MISVSIASQLLQTSYNPATVFNLLTSATTCDIFCFFMRYI